MVGIPLWGENNTSDDWVLPEGRLSVFKSRTFISYNLKTYSDFDPDRGVATPEEMAALVNINTQGRQPEKFRDDVVAYRNVSGNGKTLDLFIGSDTIHCVWMKTFLIGRHNSSERFSRPNVGAIS